MKVLYWIDPHVQVSNLEESHVLAIFVVDSVAKHKPDMIVITGDLFNNFAIVRTETLDFWREWLDTLSKGQKLIVMVGNHDYANSGDDAYASNALSVFRLMKKKNLHIIDTAQVHNNIGFVPYTHDQEKFLEIANGLKPFGAKILAIHQDIDGSQYENGFYSPGGVDTNRLDYPLIIGGHIHKRQRFGKVILPGTARWLTASDANEEKGLWLAEHDDETGLILSEEFLDTSSVCKPILELTYREGELEPTISENARVSLTMVGSSDWISKEKHKFKGKVNLKTRFTDSKKSKTRNAGKGFEDFVKNTCQTSVDRDSLLKLAKEYGLV